MDVFHVSLHLYARRARRVYERTHHENGVWRIYALVVVFYDALLDESVLFVELHRLLVARLHVQVRILDVFVPPRLRRRQALCDELSPDSPISVRCEHADGSDVESRALFALPLALRRLFDARRHSSYEKVVEVRENGRVGGGLDAVVVEGVWEPHGQHSRVEYAQLLESLVVQRLQADVEVGGVHFARRERN